MLHPIQLIVIASLVLGIFISSLLSNIKIKWKSRNSVPYCNRWRRKTVNSTWHTDEGSNSTDISAQIFSHRKKKRICFSTLFTTPFLRGFYGFMTQGRWTFFFFFFKKGYISCKLEAVTYIYVPRYRRQGVTPLYIFFRYIPRKKRGKKKKNPLRNWILQPESVIKKEGQPPHIWLGKKTILHQTSCFFITF